jgi:hypothetical protein
MVKTSTWTSEAAITRRWGDHNPPAELCLLRFNLESPFDFHVHRLPHLRTVGPGLPGRAPLLLLGPLLLGFLRTETGTETPEPTDEEILQWYQQHQK